MASARSGRAFPTESPEGSETEDNVQNEVVVPSSSAPIAPPVLDSATLVRIMHSLQLQAGDQRQIAKDLQQQLRAAEQQTRLQAVSAAAASASATSSSKRMPSSNTPAHQLTAAHASGSTVSSSTRINPDVARLPDEDPGKNLYVPNTSRFFMLCSPWISTEDLTRSLVPLDARTREAYALNQDERRFRNEESLALGFTAEIYHFFPTECHEGLRGSPVVQRLIRETLSNKRSTLMHVLRNHFHRIFRAFPEGVRNAIATKSFEDYPEAKYWVCGNDDEQKKGKGWAGVDYPPCYYPPGQYKKRRLVFQTEWIVNVVRILLWGPTALKTEKQQEPAQNSTATLLDIDDITAGAIAFACVIVRYLLGPDTSFGSLGQHSKLATRAHFFAIRNFLLEASCAGLKWVAELFRFVRDGALPPSRRKRLVDPLSNSPAVPVADHDEAQRRLAREDPSDSESEADTSVDFNTSATILDDDNFTSPLSAQRSPIDADAEAMDPVAHPTVPHASRLAMPHASHLTAPHVSHPAAPTPPPVSRPAAVTTIPVTGVPQHIAFPSSFYDDMPPLMPPSAPLASDLLGTQDDRSNAVPLPVLSTFAQTKASNLAAFSSIISDLLSPAMNEGATLTIDAPQPSLGELAPTVPPSQVQSSSSQLAVLDTPAATQKSVPKPRPKTKAKTVTTAAPATIAAAVAADDTFTAAADPEPVLIPDDVPAVKAPRRSRRGKDKA